jgi:cobalt-zinc-cadmium efflux system protein
MFTSAWFWRPHSFAAMSRPTQYIETASITTANEYGIQTGPGTALTALLLVRIRGGYHRHDRRTRLPDGRPPPKGAKTAAHRVLGPDAGDVSTEPGKDERFVVLSLCLILGFMAFEVAFAFIAHSLALLADAGHMLTDAAALIAALVALRLARRPASGPWTFGLKRAEVLSAQANGITLLVIGALIAFEAIGRLIHPSRVTGTIVIAVASVGVLMNVAATFSLSRANRRSLNIKGAFQHILTDSFAFAGTIVAGIIIVTTGYRRADSIASLIVVALMVRAAFGLLRETGRVLLEAAPPGFDPAVIAEDIVSNPCVESVHDVHIWLITSGFPALSAHVLVQNEQDCHGVRRELEEMLAEKYELEHTTLQVDHAASHHVTLGPTHRRSPEHR